MDIFTGQVKNLSFLLIAHALGTIILYKEIVKHSLALSQFLLGLRTHEMVVTEPTLNWPFGLQDDFFANLLPR